MLKFLMFFAILGFILAGCSDNKSNKSDSLGNFSFDKKFDGIHLLVISTLKNL